MTQEGGWYIYRPVGQGGTLLNLVHIRTMWSSAFIIVSSCWISDSFYRQCMSYECVQVLLKPPQSDQKDRLISYTRHLGAATGRLPINWPETCDHQAIASNVTRNQRTLINDASGILLKVTRNAGNQDQSLIRECPVFCIHFKILTTKFTTICMYVLYE
jgi:hypothetical protein